MTSSLAKFWLCLVGCSIGIGELRYLFLLLALWFVTTLTSYF